MLQSVNVLILFSASLNKDKVMGATASLRLGPKREYSFESTMQTTNTKTKIMYKPQISVRSPTAEIFALAITHTNVINKQKSIDVAIDKIVTKPIIFSGKMHLIVMIQIHIYYVMFITTLLFMK